MGLNLKKFFGKIKREKKRIEQPESIKKEFERAFYTAAHEYFMSMPNSYFLRGPRYGKK